MAFDNNSALHWYLDEIRKSPLLTAQEEKDLADRVHRQHDRLAREKMIRCNLRLVVAVARRFAHRGVNLTDLIAEGNVGLVHAVDLFDPKHEVRFSTYATWWIRQSIRRVLLTANRPVRLPAYMASRIARLQGQKQMFRSEHGHLPTDEQIATDMHTTLRKIAAIQRAARTFGVSTAMRLAGDDQGKSLDDLLLDQHTPHPGHEIEAHELAAKIDGLLEQLPSREARVLRLRHGLGSESALTLNEIAEMLGVTRERVRQLEVKALRKLHNLLNDYQHIYHAGSARISGALHQAAAV